MDFQRLGVCDELVNAIQQEGWERPTDCQEEAIPLILGGGDVLLAAPTGSGKTAAFVLPVLQIVWEMLQQDAPNYDQDHRLCMNYIDSDSELGVSSDGLKVSNPTDQWKGCRGTTAASGKGKFYFECTVQGNPKAISRVGWCTQDDSLNLGTSSNGYGFGGTGKKCNGGKFLDYGTKYSVGDVIGCSLNLVEGSISFSKNGVDLGIAFNNVKKGLSYFPTVCMKGGEMAVNFGTIPSNPLKYLPAGFTPIPEMVETKKPVQAGIRNIMAIILEPTRELAEQTYDALNQFKGFMSNPSISVGIIAGGERADPKSQLKTLMNCHIIVSSPNVFMEAIRRHSIQLNNLMFLIMDEADKLIEDDANSNIMKIYGRIPSRSTTTGEYRLQVCLFSATLHSMSIHRLANAVCVNPIWVDLKGKDYVPERVQQVVSYIDVTQADLSPLYAYQQATSYTDQVHPSNQLPNILTTREQKSEAVKRAKLNVVKALIDKYQMSRVMIFCRTNVDCNNLESFFIKEGNGQKIDAHNPLGMAGAYSCCVLAGMRDTVSRKFALDSFKNGSVRILICTDVAARGIDIKDLPFMINMTLPDTVEQYIHRIGRVGRSDRVGLAISLVSKEEEKVWYHTCNRGRDRKKVCHNTKLVEQGGCCIWMNEMEMMKLVEERIAMEVPELTADLSLPEGMSLGNITRNKNDKLIEMAVKNAATIQQNVEMLSRLESETQFAYLYLKSQTM